MSSTRSKKCCICGKEFYPRNSRHMACSPECSEIKKIQAQEEYVKKLKKRFRPKKCLFCKKRFRPKSLKQKYCCRECAGYAMRKQIISEDVQYADVECHFNEI